jgi:superfamily II DNA/RNA helicase
MAEPALPRLADRMQYVPSKKTPPQASKPEAISDWSSPKRSHQRNGERLRRSISVRSNWSRSRFSLISRCQTYPQKGQGEVPSGSCASHSGQNLVWNHARFGVLVVETGIHLDRAEAVVPAFRDAGATAETMTGEMPGKERADLVARFDRGQVQVLTNCMVLTEAFDSQPVGCVVILRPMLHKGTFIQPVGRGLRKVAPSAFPGSSRPTALSWTSPARRSGTAPVPISAA